MDVKKTAAGIFSAAAVIIR